MRNFQLSALALAIGATPFALADSDKTPDKMEVMEVTGSRTSSYAAKQASGASRLNLDAVDTPQSVSVISADLMQDYQLTNINDALDAATGVQVQRVETDRVYYTARGFEINNFQVDGIGLPITNDNTHGNIETALYEKIEVIRGANGLMTGVGNPSATINLVRKRPGELPGGALAVTGGSWDKQRLQVDANAPLSDSVRARVVAVDQSKESYLDRKSSQKSVFYGVVEADLTANTLLTVGHSYSDGSTNGNLWGALPLYYTDGTPTDYDRSTSTSADWSNWNIVKENTFAEIQHQFNNDWSATAIYSHSTADEDSELFYVSGTPNRETGLGTSGLGSEYDLDERRDMLDVYVNGNFELGDREHQVAAGASYAEMSYTDISWYDRSTGNGFPPMPDLAEWDGNTPLPVFRDTPDGSDIEQTQTAYYATGRFNLLDGWHIIAGGRYNKHEVEGISYGVNQSSDESEFIPYLGSVYEFAPGVKAYASYTETFVPQTELGTDDKRLDPITGESAEVGVKAELFDGRLLATAAYFDVQQVNLAKLDPATADLDPINQRYIGAEGVQSNGFEVDVSGEILPGLQTSLGLTDFDIEGDDLIANYTPDTLIKATATYTPPALQKVSVGMNMRWQDDISREQGVVGEGFANAGETIVTRQDAYAIVNLMARYEFTENLSLQLNANNVTDEKYINSLYWAQGYYGAPANYSATLKWAL